eukprot:scaffold4749_cov137-Isochrysis_galbana.AAC.3
MRDAHAVAVWSELGGGGVPLTPGVSHASEAPPSVSPPTASPTRLSSRHHTSLETVADGGASPPKSQRRCMQTAAAWLPRAGGCAPLSLGAAHSMA